MKPLRIAFLPITRVQFDIGLAGEMISQAREQLQAAGFDLHGPDQPISNFQAAQNAVQNLGSSPVDLTVVFQATFADSSMVVAIAEEINAPLFLWAVPEPWTGERLRLNSLCGINLAAHALTLRERTYEYAYATPGESKVVEQIRNLAMASSLRRELEACTFGVVGEHPKGMDTCRLDEAGLQSLFGLKIRHIELLEVFQRAHSIPHGIIEQTRTSLDSRMNNLTSLNQEPLDGTLSVYHALKEIALENKLDGLAVRCWPEFFTELGCAACGALSMLSDGFEMDSPLPCSCEADINGAISQRMLQFLASEPAFGTDIVGVEQEKGLVALWHCGLAPLAMADPARPIQGGLHSNRKLPLVMDFTLKPGPITYARLSQASGKLQLVVGSGEMLDLPKPFGGTSGTMKPARGASEFLDSLLGQGLEHHISLVYGNYSQSLTAFARLVRMPVLTL